MQCSHWPLLSISKMYLYIPQTDRPQLGIVLCGPVLTDLVHPEHAIAFLHGHSHLVHYAGAGENPFCHRIMRAFIRDI
jgi:hypothetical protein